MFRFVLPLLALALVGCGSEPPPPAPPPPPPLVVKVAADPELVPVAEALLAHSPRDVDGEVVPLEDGPAYRALLAGEVHGVIALRPPNVAEREAARGDGLLTERPLRAFAVAEDPLALVAPPGSALGTLSLEDAASALLTGRLVSGREVTLVGLPAASPSGELVRRALLGGQTLHTSLQELGRSDEVARRVREEPGSLGYCSGANLLGVGAVSLRTDAGVVVPGDDGWPLRRSILLVTQGETEPGHALAAAIEPAAERLSTLGYRPGGG